jgi:hypothetical protein
MSRLQRSTEYRVNVFDEHGDVIDLLNHDSLADARRDFDSIDLDEQTTRIDLERVVRWGNDDRGIVREDFYLIAEKGVPADPSSRMWVNRRANS